MAKLAGRGRLAVGGTFVHESYIGSRLTGRVEATTRIGGIDAILPSIEGWAHSTGCNHIGVDRSDPFWAGFQVV